LTGIVSRSNLSLKLDKGRIVSIVGPSGCGKTTLLNTLCGLITPDAGRISWYGRAIAGQPQNVGYMLQKDLLLPWRTAHGNVMLGLEIRGVAANEAHDRSRILDQLRAPRLRRTPFDAFGRHAPARGWRVPVNTDRAAAR
jgi:ABC-type nitrate/sulfonate/bicarbonate transport system ATPase subunit